MKGDIKLRKPTLALRSAAVRRRVRGGCERVALVRALELPWSTVITIGTKRAAGVGRVVAPVVAVPVLGVADQLGDTRHVRVR